METSIWPTKERIDYSTLMLIYIITDSRKKKWERELKTRIKNETQQRLTNDLKEKTKARTMQKGQMTNEKIHKEW